MRQLLLLFLDKLSTVSCVCPMSRKLTLIQGHLHQQHGFTTESFSGSKEKLYCLKPSPGCHRPPANLTAQWETPHAFLSFSAWTLYQATFGGDGKYSLYLNNKEMLCSSPWCCWYGSLKKNMGKEAIKQFNQDNILQAAPPCA